MRLAFLSGATALLVLLVVTACTDNGADANDQAEWAECVAQLDSDSSFFPDREFYDFSVMEDFMNRCDANEQGLTTLWITCILEEFEKLSPDAANSIDGSKDVAKECDEELEEVTKEAEWVACMLSMDADPTILAGPGQISHEFVDFTTRNGYRESCPSGEDLTNLWITCIGQELEKTNPDLALSTDNSIDVSRDCAEKVPEQNEQAEWVECMVSLDSDPEFFLDEPDITFEAREVFIDRCDPDGDGLTNLWITCIYDESSSEAITVAETCSEKLD